ncbi:hypothetical protein B0H11DRAFT_1915013 [Mycena galericulata]|nr:hypothetical protein B0H11DRAFT_1915013 [Mycena galericulata]
MVEYPDQNGMEGATMRRARNAPVPLRKATVLKAASEEPGTGGPSPCSVLEGLNLEGRRSVAKKTRATMYCNALKFSPAREAFKTLYRNLEERKKRNEKDSDITMTICVFIQLWTPLPAAEEAQRGRERRERVCVREERKMGLPEDCDTSAKWATRNRLAQDLAGCSCLHSICLAGHSEKESMRTSFPGGRIGHAAIYRLRGNTGIRRANRLIPHPENGPKIEPRSAGKLTVEKIDDNDASSLLQSRSEDEVSE